MAYISILTIRRINNNQKEQIQEDTFLCNMNIYYVTVYGTHNFTKFNSNFS